MRSLAEMEEAGYAHLLKDEASGALQKRHPFIYASAPELRISDVSHLLAAYKRIVSLISSSLYSPLCLSPSYLSPVTAILPSNLAS